MFEQRPDMCPNFASESREERQMFNPNKTSKMKNYRVSIDGWSMSHATREAAISAAERAAEQNPDAEVKVFGEYNRIIWEN